MPLFPVCFVTHAFSGCDTVPAFFGIGKGNVLKILMALPESLTKLG